MINQDKQLLADLENGMIATDTFLKSFSVDIRNTTEAIDLMKEYSKSGDEGIRREMLYRLGKVR